MKYLAIIILFSITTPSAIADLNVTGTDLTARDISSILRLQTSKLRISHDKDERILLDIKVAVLEHTPDGKVNELRSETLEAMGRSPKWKHTDVVFSIHDSKLVVITTKGADTSLKVF